MTISSAEQNRRWRKKYPEKVKEQKRKYLARRLEKRLKDNPLLLDNLRAKLLYDFDKLTRLTWSDKLPTLCEVCGSTEDLHIHHKRYAYPIIRDDIVRLCRRCHVEEHQKLTPMR